MSPNQIHMPDTKKPSGTARKVLSFLTTVFVFITLISLGFAACAAPQSTTRFLSERYSASTLSPFSHEELVKAAVATRDYTVSTNDKEALYKVLYEINESLPSESRLHGAPILPDSNANIEELEASFELADEAYVLTDDALSHLDDVFDVVMSAKTLLKIGALLAFIGCVVIGIRFGRKTLGSVLLISGLGVIAVFLLLVLWVAIDFNGFFTVFHSLFFAEGTWTFSIDSLLICMYPTSFWISMGAVWLATTLIGCLLCVIAGITLKRQARKRLIS